VYVLQSRVSTRRPSACEYCNVIAAFIGNRCQRCANSEKRWGPPQTCEQCKQQCAFDRSEESKKKVDGKVLCWLCTMAYKRVLAKTRKRDGNTPLLEKSSSNNSSSGGDNSLHAKHHKKHHHHHSSNHGSHHHHHHKSKDKDKEKKDHKNHSSHKSKSDTDQKSSKDTPRSDKTSASDLGASAAKKQKLDKSTANGVNLTPKPSKETSLDMSSTENMVAMTQLKEEVESLKKQLSQKSTEILERDKKVTELKATQFEVDKNTRTKITNLQKDHAEAVQSLQTKNRDLSRQVAALSKGGKKSLKEEKTNSPSV
jgi:hypothetical protein